MNAPRSGRDAGVSGIVLAGGRSARFGADKLGVVLDGRAILVRAVEAVGSACAEVIVVTAPGAAARTSELLRGARSATRVIEDARSFDGPLVALELGLREAHAPVCIVTAGDMPWLDPAMLALLVAELVPDVADAPAADALVVAAAAFVFGDHLERFPFVARRDLALAAVERLLAAGERRMRALIRGLDPLGIPEWQWRPVDPSGRTFRDVDRPADLTFAADPAPADAPPRSAPAALPSDT
jgi:molybdopterin-guanine dinucleotide biosynthesis protein A